MFAALLLAAAVLQGGCAGEDGLAFICGPVASEDLVRIPATPWLIASGLDVGEGGHLYLIDHRTGRTQVLFPAGAAARVEPAYRGTCSAPPQFAKVSLDGLALRAGPAGRHTLFAANHGDRHAIEVFDLDARGERPRATWIGCVPLPAGTLANGVVALRDGGLIFSSFHDPRDTNAWARMARGEATGGLWEWHPGSAVRPLGMQDISGANGLEISADERTLYVSSWSTRKLLSIDRGTLQRRELALDFLPDNIHRSDDGALLLAGQRGTVENIAACNGPACPQDWIIARVDPERGTVTPLLTRAGSASVSYACGAQQVDDTLYVTARADRRIIRVPVSALPSLR